MLFTAFLVFALLCALVYLAAASTVSVWGALLAFALGYVLANLLFVVGLFVDWVCLPPVPEGEPIQKQNQLARWLSGATGRFLSVHAGLRVKLSGLDKLPAGRFLFVCNHRSVFDPLVTIGWLGKYNISFISKPSNMKMVPLDRVARHAGYLPIDRENNREALKTILTAADYLKRDLCSIGIYPEGTRSKTEEMLPFHAGSFKIAQRAGVPLVVACIRGTELAHTKPLLPIKPVRLDILAVIDAETVKALSTNELSERARALIQARLNGEAEA